MAKVARCAVISHPLKKIHIAVITAYFTYIQLIFFHKPPYKTSGTLCCLSFFCIFFLKTAFSANHKVNIRQENNMFFAFCCIIAIVLLIVAIYVSFFKDEDLGFDLLLCSIFFFILTTISGSYYFYKEGEVQGLLCSGKYEIVDNDNYSLNELKSFIKINGYYLKEVDENE